jgi:uncharacterized protein YpmB
MKKSRWIILFLTIFAIVVAILFSIYSKTMSPDTKYANEAIERAKQIVQINKVNNVEHFFGKQAYRVIDAETADGEFYIFVPEDKSLKITTVKKEDGISKQAAKKIVLQTKSNIEVLSIRLAIDKELPLWEVVYQEQDSQRTFIYITFKSGEFYKRLTISN